MLKWLASLVCSSLTFAIADVLCDICIAEHDEDAKTVESAADDEGSEGEVDMQSQAGAPGVKQDRYVRDSDGGLQRLGVTLSRPNAAPRDKQISGDGQRTPTDWSSAQPAAQHEDELVALTGEQDAAVAGALAPRVGAFLAPPSPHLPVWCLKLHRASLPPARPCLALARRHRHHHHAICDRRVHLEPDRLDGLRQRGHSPQVGPHNARAVLVCDARRLDGVLALLLPAQGL